jgi:hypothetical protein
MNWYKTSSTDRPFLKSLITKLKERGLSDAGYGMVQKSLGIQCQHGPGFTDKTMNLKEC